MPDCVHGHWSGGFRKSLQAAVDSLHGQPPGTFNTTLDAGGCDIGIYYGPGQSGLISGAEISGATYFAVLVNGAAVNVLNSTINNVGSAIASTDSANYPPTGIFYLGGANCPTQDGPSACRIDGNTITQALLGRTAIAAKNAGTM
jgi:hypothetical protein